MRNASLRVLLTLSWTIITCLHTPAQEPRPQLLKEVPPDKIVASDSQEAHKLQHLRDMPTTKSVELVNVDKDAINSSQFSVRIPEIGDVQATKTGGTPEDKDRGSWYGIIEGSKPGTITLVWRDGKITGSINGPSGLFRIVPIKDDLYALVGVDSKKFPPDEPPSAKSPE